MKGFIRNFFCAIFCLMFTAGFSLASDPPLVLSDDFSSSITDNWIPGRAANEGGGTHALSIEDGELVWVQNYDYIESKALFGNDLKIEFDYRAGLSSIQAGEFWVELVALTDAGEYTAGIYRSRYGLQNYHAINIGRAPSPADSTVKDKILDPPYLETLEPGDTRQGKIIFSCADQKVQMQFENSDQEILSTNQVNTGTFSQTKIRIWGMGSSGGPRYIDNIRIYSSSENPDPDDPSPDPVTGNGAYTFVKIADTESADFVALDMQPTLNDSGTVAFWAEGPDSVYLAPYNYGDDGIYTGSGGPLTTVLHADEDNMQDIWGYKSINNSGAVAVQLEYLQNNTVIEIRQNGSKTTVVSTETTDFTHLGDPQINDDGLVSFWGQEWRTNVGVYQGIYTGNGNASIATVIDYTAGTDFYRFAEATSINNSGEVAFAAKADGGEYKLYKSDGTTLTYIAGPGGQFEQTGGNDGQSFALNNNGEVVFQGFSMDGVWSLTGMFSSNGAGATQKVLANTDGTTPFMFVLSYPAMNDAGNFVFMGLLEGISSGGGVYAGTDPQAHKVLEAGDMLDGKEVSTVSVGRHSINNHGQIVFHVSFTDASQAIFRADPPASVHTLTDASPDITVPAGAITRIYGTTGVNRITLESKAQAELVNFPGENLYVIQSSAALFMVSRSGATVTFQGSDDTKLKMPATAYEQTIMFNDSNPMVLRITGNQVMLGDQVIGTETALIAD